MQLEKDEVHKTSKESKSCQCWMAGRNLLKQGWRLNKQALGGDTTGTGTDEQMPGGGKTKLCLRNS